MSFGSSIRIFYLLVVTATFLLAGCSPDPYAVSITEYRDAYLHDLMRHPQSPLTEEALAHISYFKPDKSLAVTARIEEVKDAKPFDMPTYSGETKPYITYGKLHFTIGGKACALTVYQQARYPKVPGQDSHLFLPFKDQTNDLSTYGGGRYLDLQVTDIEDGYIEIDFNKAYNPWCAYADGYRCPIPPPENHLDLEIRAGEKTYTGPIKPAG